MLTESQINQLQPLTLDPEYGELLKDAIETWKQSDVIPCCNGFGIYFDDELGKFQFDNDDKQCCLISAAILKKSFEVCCNQFITRSCFIKKFYNISITDFGDLWQSFDGCYDVKDSSASEFAIKVRNIVNPSCYKSR